MEEKDIIELLGKVSFKDETFSGQTEVWENIKHSIDSRKTKTIWMHRSWIIAASVAVILCITCWFSMKTTVISSDHSMAVSLPDGSEVELAAGASVSYSRLKWLFTRTIRLHGNAGFDVTKGKRFTVKTDCGSITVLGTKFQITQVENTSLHVECYEGSVQVETKAGKEILMPGEQVDYDASGMRPSKIEVTLPEYLEFTAVPLSRILERLEEIYGLEISGMDICKGYTFSGLLSTQNKEEALEVLFGSCNLGYSLNGDNVLLKK